MEKLQIITQPNNILRNQSQEIKEITPEIKRLILDMAQTMKKEDGIGLAAPQIGKNIRLIVINTGNGVIEIINPKITWRSLRKEIEEEGCLSCPKEFGPVKRNKSINLKYLNKEGKEIKIKAKGLFARVIQHEVDHLDGVLIIDKFVKK